MAENRGKTWISLQKGARDAFAYCLSSSSSIQAHTSSGIHPYTSDFHFAILSPSRLASINRETSPQFFKVSLKRSAVRLHPFCLFSSYHHISTQHLTSGKTSRYISATGGNLPWGIKLRPSTNQFSKGQGITKIIKVLTSDEFSCRTFSRFWISRCLT